MLTITRDLLTVWTDDETGEPTGQLWVDHGAGTHAVLMHRDADGIETVWIETDSSTAAQYSRVYGAHRSARIVDGPTDADLAAIEGESPAMGPVERDILAACEPWSDPIMAYGSTHVVYPRSWL